MPDLVSDLRRRIAEAGDAERAPQMQAYMKSALPFRGVPAPVLRVLCRDVVAAHPLSDRAAWEHSVHELFDDAQFREERYAALALVDHRLYRGYRDPAALDLYRHLVVAGAWWDIVDAVAVRDVGDVLRRFRDVVTPVVLTWATDDDLWVRRTAVLAQLKHKAGTDTDLLLQVLEANLEDSPHGRDFFIRKALGWALREYAKTDPGWVRSFVAERDGLLSALTKREALKHLG